MNISGNTSKMFFELIKNRSFRSVGGNGSVLMARREVLKLVSYLLLFWASHQCNIWVNEIIDEMAN